MSYEVHVIADSISSSGHRITTLTATYPRFIHSELLTHRDRSRNSASSRAIPFPKLSAMVQDDPVVPLKWGMEQSGMQTGDEIPEALRPLARAIWLKARDSAMTYAKMLHYLEETAWYHDGPNQLQTVFGLSDREADDILNELAKQEMTEGSIRVHKSLPNRIIEPWMWITVVMTATEWKNFFRLRCHPHAEVHFQQIAGMMRDMLETSIPVRKADNAWHLPYMDSEDELIDLVSFVEDRAGKRCSLEEITQVACRISAARCARVSYLTHEGKRDFAKDLDLFDKLNIGSGDDLPHASPYEHPAQAIGTDERSGPFTGWRQFRKLFPMENVPG